jgi:hypothetical protein
MTDKTKPNDRTVEHPQEPVTEEVADTGVTAVAALDSPQARPEPPGGAPLPGSGDDDPHANLAAYLLDSLSEDERAAFAAHFATCAVCQEDAAALAPVVGSLPGLLDLDPSTDLQSPEIAPLPADLEPSPELRGRILAAVRGESIPPAAAAEQAVDIVPEAAEAEEQAGEQQAAVEPTPITTARRPPGRILPGTSPGPASVTSQAWQTVSRVSWATRFAALFAIVAVGAIIWALALQGRINDLEDQNEGLEDIIARIESSSAATVASLAPTGPGPADASGEFFFSLPDQRGWVVLDGMNPLPENQAYQLWYIKAGDPAPKPGPVIIVDENGHGSVEVASDTPTYDQLAVTVEPRTGSEAPTSAIVLAGNLSGAAG